jgi:pimeloyl-ACP methyl ester carboxylesterase
LCDIGRALTSHSNRPTPSWSPTWPSTRARGSCPTHAVPRRLRRARAAHHARTFVGVGLRDPITPPSTVFAAYNAIEAEKEIAVFSYSGHDLPTAHAEDQLADFTRELADEPCSTIRTFVSTHGPLRL